MLSDLIDTIDNVGGDPYSLLETLRKNLILILESPELGSRDFLPIPLRRIAHSLYDSDVYRRKSVYDVFTEGQPLSESKFKFPGDGTKKYEIKLEQIFDENTIKVFDAS